MYSGLITDVPGILVGHATDRAAATGVTAIIAEHGAVAGVDVRGGGPGTRETDALAPGRVVDKIDAVLLTGGSAFGLDSASGAMKLFERQGKGYETKYARVPIVASAVLYDLGRGSSKIRPDADMGALACLAAAKEFKQGVVGAGCGATVGKLLPGTTADAGGIGSASIRLSDGVVLGAIVAANPAGDIYHPDTGELLAGGRDTSGQICPAVSGFLNMAETHAAPANTTLGVVATNAALTREQATRLALIAHDGFARAIRPVHLPVDGDTVFALSTGKLEARYILLCALTAEVVARAIANAILAQREVFS